MSALEVLWAALSILILALPCLAFVRILRRTGHCPGARLLGWLPLVLSLLCAGLIALGIVTVIEALALIALIYVATLLVIAFKRWPERP